MKSFTEYLVEARIPGKKMGHDLYVHKDYTEEAGVPQEELKQAQSKLPSDFEHTAVKYNKKDQSFSFIHSPDFNTADEPTVGKSIKVFPSGETKTTK